MEHGISHSGDYSIPSAALTDDHRREGFQQRGCRLSLGAEWGPKGLNYGAGRDVLLEGLLAFPGIWRLSTPLLPDRITASLQPLLPAPTSSSPTYVTLAERTPSQNTARTAGPTVRTLWSGKAKQTFAVNSTFS